jgi:hypothetical protein
VFIFSFERVDGKRAGGGNAQAIIRCGEPVQLQLLEFGPVIAPGVRRAAPPAIQIAQCLAEARKANEGWWARLDSNLQPYRYER